MSSFHHNFGCFFLCNGLNLHFFINGRVLLVFAAIGLSPEEADCSLRISFSDGNTKEELDALYASLEKNLQRLVRIRR